MALWMRMENCCKFLLSIHLGYRRSHISTQALSLCYMGFAGHENSKPIIDHICFFRKFRSQQDVKVKRGADAALDHHYDWFVLNIKLQLKKHRNMGHTTRQSDVKKKNQKKQKKKNPQIPQKPKNTAPPTPKTNKQIIKE